jgi:hypothetical protein
VRNITVSVDDETYKRARIVAAEQDTSVSALVKTYLIQLATQESEFDRLKRLEQEIRDQILSFNASDRVTRDELHDRHL